MSNGWYQLENHRPWKVPPYVPAGPHGRTPAPNGAPMAPPPPPSRPEPSAPSTPAPTVPAPASPVPESPPAPKWERAGTPPTAKDAALHTQTVDPRGPALLQDGVLHETLETFVVEKPRERAVHVKGWGATGSFECARPMGDVTLLPFLQREGQRTPAASRFSLAVSNRGTPDASRNVRGFSTKFYTDAGVFDLLCNHLPVFAVRDAIRFPEVIRALLPSKVSGLGGTDRFWDFVARTPETVHFVTWLYSDVGTLKSLRRMRAYGVNTYVWRNGAGERRYVKYHWLPLAGTEYITAAESAALAGDPDVAGRDLYEAIARGEFPQYELRVQLMDPAEAERLPFDPLDDTKVWDEERWPLTPVGRLTLNQNPEDYRREVERLAFSPANLLPGAELSDDRMLQGRSFIYWDAQRRRLGPDFRELPVNRQGGWAPGRQVSSGLGAEACGVQARSPGPKQDDFGQAGARYRAFSPEERERLCANIAGELKRTSGETRQAVLGSLRQADEEYGRGVADRMEE